MLLRKIFLITLVLITASSFVAGQQIEAWSDHDNINADGDTLQISYSNIKKDNITRLEVRVNNNTLKTFNSSKDQITLTYDQKLDGSENMTLWYKEDNSTWKIQNIDEPLIRYETRFKGFFKGSNRVTRQLYFRELEDINAKIEVTKTNGNTSSNAKGLLGEDFKVFSGQSTADFTLEGSSSSPYTIRFSSLPKMTPGKKQFTLRMKNGPEIKDFTIQKRVAFQGKVLDLTGAGRNAEFEIIDNSIKTFNTDNGGNFLQLFEQERVDKTIKLYLGNVTTTFGGMEISSEREENIRYEFYKGLNPDEINTGKSVKPVNVIAFSSNYPIDIEDTSITMKYDSSRINPEEVEFYECSYWDFMGQECRVNWEEKDDVENNELLNEATLTDLETQGDGDYGLKSAYMAAVKYEKPQIQLEQDKVSKNKYNIEERIVLEGNLIDDKDSSAVENAEIQVKLFKNDNESIKAEKGFSENIRSNEAGFFSLTPLNIPDHAGNYTLEFTASKDNLKDLEIDKNIKITERTSIEIEAPAENEITVGETNTLVFTVRNSGQAPAENVTITETNIDSKYYSRTPKTINEISPGDSKTVTITFIPPTSYCESTNCDKDIEISARGQSNGKEVYSDSNIQINNPVKNLETGDKNKTRENTTKNTSTNTDNNNTGNTLSAASNLPEVITGNLNDNTSTKTVLALSLITILSLAAGIKKYKSEADIKIRKERDPGIVVKIGANIPQLSNSIKDMRTAERTVEKSSKPSITSREHENNSSSEEIRKGVCPECGEKFDTETALNFHRKHSH